MPKKLICNIEYFSEFTKLWKTKKALQNWWEEEQRNTGKMFEILKEYYPKTGKNKEKVTWKDIADRVFSEYIRLLYADDNWYCMCITCNKKHLWNSWDMQCWHFRTRAHLFSRFLLDNNHPQCHTCNYTYNGNYRNYSRYMIAKYWEEKEDFLWNNTIIKKIYDSEYMDMIYWWYDFIVNKKEIINKNKI